MGVQGLNYGSKLLYTNSDWSSKAPADTMVKIGGQEVRVTAAADHVLTLSEPYLGASIIPTLTDTGITAAVGGIAASTLAINAPGTSIISNHVLNGAKLYCGGCSFRAEHSDTAATIKTATSLTISTGHGCHRLRHWHLQVHHRRQHQRSERCHHRHHRELVRQRLRPVHRDRWRRYRCH